MLWKQARSTSGIDNFDIVDIIDIIRSSIPEGKIENAAYPPYP